MSKDKKILAFLIAIIVFVIGGILLLNSKVFKGDADDIVKPVRVGLSLDHIRSDRWKAERDYITERAASLGATVTTFVANSDDDVQISQIDNLIGQKVDVLIVVAHNAKALIPILVKAHAAGIKILAYDRLLVDAPYVDFYLSFDNVKVGRLEAQGVLDIIPTGNYVYLGGSPTDNNALLVKQGAMEVLQPKIDSGDVRIVYDAFTKDWNATEAYKNLKSYLMTNTKIDAIVAASDNISLGAILALQEYGLAGKVPISGQDAEIQAFKRILDGTQSFTIYKKIKDLSYQATDIAIALARNGEAKANATTNNGVINIPSYLMDVTLVNKNNIVETVIKDGLHTYEAIYGVPQP